MFIAIPENEVEVQVFHSGQSFYLKNSNKEDNFSVVLFEIYSYA